MWIPAQFVGIVSHPYTCICTCRHFPRSRNPAYPHVLTRAGIPPAGLRQAARWAGRAGASGKVRAPGVARVHGEAGGVPGARDESGAAGERRAADARALPLPGQPPHRAAAGALGASSL